MFTSPHLFIPQPTQGYASNSTLDIAAYVADMGNGNAMLSFRGTDPSDLKNWIADLYASKTKPLVGCDGCLVHAGFHDSFLSVRSQVIGFLNQVENLETVYITGHSLGAALSALAAWDLQYNNPTAKIGTFYNFGQPRVGNDAFANSFKSQPFQEFRVVHYKDVVPHLPTEGMGFHHVPTEVFYNEASSSYTVCDGSGEDNSCSDQFAFPDSVSDHLDYLNVKISEVC